MCNGNIKDCRGMEEVIILIKLTIILPFDAKLYVIVRLRTCASAINVLAFDKRRHLALKQLWYRAFHNGTLHFVF